MRHLATVQRVEEVRPFEGADRIERVRVGGWWVVVKKGEFAPGDPCVYFEIDSFLPVRPEFEFLLRGSKKKTMLHEGREREGIRLKTITLRGQVSQGLALRPEALGIPKVETGFDCSEMLDVVKYEPPVPASIAGVHAGPFPGFIPKTDEERIQNRPDLLETLRGGHFHVTSKLDGTSVTYYRSEGRFGVCGRNFELAESGGNVFFKLARERDLPGRLPEGFAVQGECAGEGIQANPLKMRGQDVFVFHVYDIARREYLEPEPAKRIAADIGLPAVPVVDEDFVLDHTLDELLALADAPSPLNPHVRQEGLVFRLKGAPRKISFKVISNRYLLDHDG
ncbi:MAG: RNA ligase (ATP) [Planctomycetes bacterium]|nr:RNA ligase (ATP) [Planctomycetota bacterium]